LEWWKQGHCRNECMIVFFLIVSHVLKFDTICVMILILVVAIGTLCCNGVGFKYLTRFLKLVVTFKF
jgi:hypothetical protein